MPIIYPLRVPLKPGFAQFAIYKCPVVGETQSPYDGSQQKQVYPGQWWEGTITLPGLIEKYAAVWEAWIGKLNGKQGTFLFSDPVRKRPLGVARDNIVLDGNGNPTYDAFGDFIVDDSEDEPVADEDTPKWSQEVVIRGLRPDIEGWMLAGSYIQWGSGASARLHQVLDDVDTDGDGKATLLLWPRTRELIQEGDPLIYMNTKCVFSLAENYQGFSRRPGPKTDFSFSCKEAL